MEYMMRQCLCGVGRCVGQDEVVSVVSGGRTM